MNTILELMEKYPHSGIEKLRDVYRPGLDDACITENLPKMFTPGCVIINAFYTENDVLEIIVEELVISDNKDRSSTLLCENSIKIEGSELNFMYMV